MKQDSVWKDTLEELFQEFIAFFFPDIFKAINWKIEPEFLEAEFQKIAHDSETGKKVVDKLVKVTLKSGIVASLLIHMEVQGQSDPSFAERMFTYMYRIRDHRKEKVIGIAVLADTSPTFRPESYTDEILGVEIIYKYRTIKLIDYLKKSKALERSDNPFAHVVKAFLKAIETEGNDIERHSWKKRFILNLYDTGISRKTFLSVYKFIDGIMRLPKSYEDDILTAVQIKEGKNKMSYITTAEQFGIEKGKKEGKKEGLQIGLCEGLWKSISDILEFKFGETGLNLLPQVQNITQVDKLQSLFRALLQIDEISQAKIAITNYFPQND